MQPKLNPLATHWGCPIRRVAPGDDSARRARQFEQVDVVVRRRGNPPEASAVLPLDQIAPKIIRLFSGDRS